MSKQTIIILASVLAVILLASGAYFLFFSNKNEATTDLALISREEAKIQELSPEAREFLESSGTFNTFEIKNPIDDNTYTIANTEDGKTVITVDEDQVIPLYNTLSAVPIAEDKIVITTGEYDTSSPDQNGLKSDPKAYIYNLKDQTATVFFEPEGKITDLFALVKGGKIVLSLGNEVQVYNQEGKFDKSIYTTEDKNEQIVITNQEGTGENQVKILVLGEGEKVLEV